METNQDRRVHILLRDGREIVRYDRAGKWYIEYPTGRRVHLLFSDVMSWMTEPGAEVRFGVPGGARFDVTARELLAKES